MWVKPARHERVSSACISLTLESKSWLELLVSDLAIVQVAKKYTGLFDMTSFARSPESGVPLNEAPKNPFRVWTGYLKALTID